MTDDEYELGAEEFYFDVLLPMLPGVGWIAIIFGFIDMEVWDEGDRFHTQGQVRATSALVSHVFYLVLLVILVVL